MQGNTDWLMNKNFKFKIPVKFSVVWPSRLRQIRQRRWYRSHSVKTVWNKSVNPVYGSAMLSRSMLGPTHMMQMWQVGGQAEQAVSCWAEINKICRQRPRRTKKNNLTGLTWRPQRHHPQRPGKRPGHLAVRSPLRLTPGRRKVVVWGRRRRRRCCRRLLGFSFPAVWVSQAMGGTEEAAAGPRSDWWGHTPAWQTHQAQSEGACTKQEGLWLTHRHANWCKLAKQNASHHFVSESL